MMTQLDWEKVITQREAVRLKLEGKSGDVLVDEVLRLMDWWRREYERMKEQGL